MLGLDIGSVLMFTAFGVVAGFGVWDWYETRLAAQASDQNWPDN